MHVKVSDIPMDQENERKRSNKTSAGRPSKNNFRMCITNKKRDVVRNFKDYASRRHGFTVTKVKSPRKKRGDLGEGSEKKFVGGIADKYLEKINIMEDENECSDMTRAEMMEEIKRAKWKAREYRTKYNNLLKVSG